MLGEEVVEAALAAPDEAPLPEPVRATLRFLRTMTLAPEELGPADADAVRAAGVTDEALEDAVEVAALFNVIDRCADAFGFRPPSTVFTPEQRHEAARTLLERGYA